MNILYFAVIGDDSLGQTSGLTSKISAQCDSMNRLGHRVCLTRVFFNERLRSNDFPFQSKDVNISNKNSLSRRMQSINALALAASKDNYDVLYLRYPLGDIFLFRTLCKILKANSSLRIVIERQALEISEIKLLKGYTKYYKYLMEKLYGKKISHLAYLNICVTNEISKYIINKYSSNAIVVANGISDITNFSTKWVDDSSCLRLVFLGNLTHWTGLSDFLLYLRSKSFLYNTLPVTVDVIGDGVCKESLMQEFKAEIESKKVAFHGYLTGRKKYSIISSSHLGIGSLACDTRGLTEGSNLKIREYCALGLPFAKSDKDTDVNCSLDISDCYIDISANINGYENLLEYACIYILPKNREAARLKLITYTKEYLLWDSKMSKLLGMLDKCSNS